MTARPDYGNYRDTYAIALVMCNFPAPNIREDEERLESRYEAIDEAINNFTQALNSEDFKKYPFHILDRRRRWIEKLSHREYPFTSNELETLLEEEAYLFDFDDDL